MTRLIDLLALSRRVAADAVCEPEVARAAIAWTLMNRASGAAGYLRADGRPRPACGDGDIRESCLRSGGRLPSACLGVMDPALCRALATVCLISCRDLADPTRGATHYHHHTEVPDWSRQMTPVALLGSYLFYRPVRRFSG